MKLMRGTFRGKWGKKRVLVLVAIVSLVGAGIYGQLPKEEHVEPYLPEALPEATGFELLSSAAAARSYLYAGQDSSGSPAGYVTVTEGPGYQGPMTVVMGWSLDGTILSLFVPEHREDMPWFEKLYDQEFLEQYVGQRYSVPLMLGDDIDAATGATVSSNGVAVGVHYGRQLVSEQLGDPYPVPKEPIKFGIAEILLLVGLGGVVVLRTTPALQRFKWRRYVILAFGLAVLGIWLSRSLSLTNFATWLIGNPPHLASNLFLYILVLGVLGLAIILGKNFYCFWLCPFAAVQEVTYRVGRGGIRPTPKWHNMLRKTRYVILWLALFLVLLLANSSVSVFEPWGTLFSLSGTVVGWVLLVVTLSLSAFVYSLWCYYICPVGAVMDIVLMIRREIRKQWSKIIKRRGKIQQAVPQT